MAPSFQTLMKILCFARIFLIADISQIVSSLLYEISVLFYLKILHCPSSNSGHLRIKIKPHLYCKLVDNVVINEQ